MAFAAARMIKDKQDLENKKRSTVVSKHPDTRTMSKVCTVNIGFRFLVTEEQTEKAKVHYVYYY